MPTDCEIYIRLEERGMSFTCTVLREGAVRETRVITPVEHPDDAVLDGYYGGSKTMD
ncbi:MAG: hypothetical protein ACE15B_13970 [Bryobacteraceae bacterium]